MKTVLFIDAVNFTLELKTYERSLITAKVNQLREFVEFFFIYKLKGTMIGELGDGFLILCPPEPHKVLNEAFACMSFIRAYNFGKDIPSILNVRIAIHYGLITPPEGDNYIDSNINLASRLEGETPPNCICVSSVVHDIVSNTLRHYQFHELSSELKGFGQSKFYIVSSESQIPSEPTRAEDRLGFYLSTIDAFRRIGNWASVRDTCKQALLDFKSNPEFTYQLGFAFSMLDEHINSISTFEECVRLDYKVNDSLYFIGYAYHDIGDIPHAIEYFNKTLEHDPNTFHAMVRLGEICLKREQYNEAWMWANKAMKLAPRYYAPRALLIALVIILKKKRSIENLVRNVPEHNRYLFRSSIESYLKTSEAINYRDQIDQAFKSIYGSSSTKKPRTNKPIKRGRNP